MDDNVSHNLPGQYVGELMEVMKHAFREREQLVRMLRIRLDKNLPEIVSSSKDDIEGIAFEIFQRAEAEGWLTDFIRAVQKQRPQNQRVKQFCARYEQFLQGQQPAQLRENALPRAHSSTGSLAPQGNAGGPQLYSEQGQSMTRGAKNIHRVDQKKKRKGQASSGPSAHFLFRGGWHHCSATHAIRHFFTGGSFLRAQNGDVCSFLSNCSCSYSLS